MQRSKPLLIIAAVLIAFTALAVLLARPRPQYDPIPDHSSLRANAWGTKALAELCRAEGLQAETWDEPLSRLTSRQQYLCVFDPTLHLSLEQVGDLLDWVEQGRYLLVAVDLGEVGEPQVAERRGPDALLLAALGLAGEAVAASDAAVPAIAGTPELRDVHSVQVPGPFRLRPATPRDYRKLAGETGERLAGPRVNRPLTRLQWQVLLGSPGQGVLLRARHGRGRVYVLCDAQMLANTVLTKRDNVVLAANLLFAPGVNKVSFDEAVHLSPRSLLSAEARELRYGVALPALLCLMAALALYLVSRGLRFGEPVPLRTPPRRSALEFVNAVADLYRRADARAAVLALLRQSFRRRLAGAAGASPELPAAGLAAAVLSRRPLLVAGRAVSAPQLTALLQQLEPRGGGQEPDERELLALTRSVAVYEEALADGRRHL